MIPFVSHLSAWGDGSHFHDGDTLRLDGINSNGGNFDFITSGTLNLKVSGDADDYLQLSTAGNQTTINFVGQNGKITADSGTIDFDDENLQITGYLTDGSITATVAEIRKKIGKILYVDADGNGDYTTIADAIADASSGDTIYVTNGTYTESAFTLSANVDLIGESRTNTIIQHSATSTFITLSGQHTIKNLTIKATGTDASAITVLNGGIADVHIYDCRIESTLIGILSGDTNDGFGTSSFNNLDIYIATTSNSNSFGFYIISNTVSPVIIQNCKIVTDRTGGSGISYGINRAASALGDDNYLDIYNSLIITNNDQSSDTVGMNIIGVGQSCIRDCVFDTINTGTGDAYGNVDSGTTFTEHSINWVGCTFKATANSGDATAIHIFSRSNSDIKQYYNCSLKSSSSSGTALDINNISTAASTIRVTNCSYTPSKIAQTAQNIFRDEPGLFQFPVLTTAEITALNKREADVYYDDTLNLLKYYNGSAVRTIPTLEDANTFLGATQFNNTVTVGVSDTGYDVKLWGATAGKYFLWDESEDTASISGNLSVTGQILITQDDTPNLAFIGNTDTGIGSGGINTVSVYTEGVERIRFDSQNTIFSGLNVGESGTGRDVNFYSDTAGSKLFWDASESQLNHTIQGGKAYQHKISGTDSVRATSTRYLNVDVIQDWSGAGAGAFPANAFYLKITDSRTLDATTFDYMRVSDRLMTRSGSFSNANTGTQYLMVDFLDMTDSGNYTGSGATLNHWATWYDGDVNLITTGAATLNFSTINSNTALLPAWNASGIGNYDFFNVTNSVIKIASTFGLNTTNVKGYRYNPTIIGADTESAFYADRSGLTLASDGATGNDAGGRIVLGAGKDTEIYYDGTDLNINAQLVGSGKLKIKGNTAVTGYLTQSSFTRIKLTGDMFTSVHNYSNIRVGDATGDYWTNYYTPFDSIAHVQIPVGYKATHVMVYGSDATNTVTVYENDITDGSTATSKGSGNVGTEVNITDVNYSTTNYLSIAVNADTNTDQIYGGYVTIAPI